ncbi:hypothetical protein FQN54_007169 [Arachnomyces sp. PD_36]|nr:hypothetical protein FQN54_007169 [Arachnomyces sp. PD_36]
MFSNLEGRSLYRVMSMSCAIGFMMFGYDAGVLGGVQTTEPFLSAIGHPKGTYIIPMIASSYTLAATVMSVIVSFVGMPLGRRNCILLGDCFVVVGGALQASSWSVPQIIIARVLCGFGIGLISSTVPTYMSEMSIRHAERGPEVAVQCIYLINGVALAYWVDFGFTRMSNQLSWRFPIALQSLFGFVSLLGMLVMPDTPRWYYAKHRFEEGDKVLSRLHALPIDHENVQRQRKEILETIELEEGTQEKFNPVTLIWDNTELRSGRRVRIGFLILTIQQMMGINVLVYYSTIIFSQVGVSNFLSQLLAAVMNTVFAMGTWFTPATIERFGRRPILLWSAGACTILMTIFVAMIGQENKTLATQWTAVATIVVFNLFFGWGWIGVPWLYGPEIAPLRHRHIGGSASSFGEWHMTFITVFAGGIAIQNIGWKIWIWQLLSCIIAIPFVYFMCPETGGKTLEEIDHIFMKKDTGKPLSPNALEAQPSDNEKENSAASTQEQLS